MCRNRRLHRLFARLACAGAGVCFTTGVRLAFSAEANGRSELENSFVAEALAEIGWDEEPNPEGKEIEAIEVHVFRVFDRRDPVPDFVNVFHARTREWVVAQDVIQRVGEAWERGRVLESERNLRALRQLSLANVVPAKGSSPDKVRMLVVVKDVWSVRLNSDWAYGSSGLDFLLLNPMEENLGGLRASLGGLFVLERDRYYLGGGITYPRMFGTNFTVAVTGGAIVNRFDRENEGSYGSFSFSSPLRFRRDRWGYGTDASFTTQIVRQYRNGQLDGVFVQTNPGDIEFLPWMYEAQSLEANYWGTRSFGITHKLDIGAGLQIADARYAVVEDLEASREAIRIFADQVLPVSDRRLSPYLSLAAYSTRFHRSLNIETLGLQEDYRLGYGLITTIFAASETLGSSRDLIGSNVSAGYTVPLGSGLLRVAASNRIVVANEQRHEAFVSARGRIVSPHTAVGRLHLDGYIGHRYQDYLNVAPFRLGGDNRLRGYPASTFDGKNLISGNAEFRTPGIDILSAQVGLAAFYDLGAATDEIKSAAFYQGTGAGVRILFPQVERTVMRLDWGLPVSGDRDVLPGAFFFTFGQAFPMPDSSGGGEAF